MESMNLCALPNVNRAAAPVAYDWFASRRNRGCRPSRVRGEVQLHRASDAPGKLCNLLGLTRCLGAALLVPALAASAQAQNNVTLAWDPSPDSAIAGYRLYEGVDRKSVV